MLNKKHTLESKKKMSISSKGKKPWNKGIKTGYAHWHGKKRSQETIEKIRAAKKRNNEAPNKEFWFKKNHIPWNKGTKGVMKAWNKKYPDFWTCPICNTEFPNKTGHNRKYCSKKCMAIAQKKKVIKGGQFKNGKEHPLWKGGISKKPYPFGWTKMLKESIRQRDNYKCQICGTPEIECLKKLHIHHIDKDKNNLNPENLITLCIKCHTKITWNKIWLKNI